MTRKQKVQAMPTRRATRAAKVREKNLGKAGPEAALGEARGKPPRSGPPGAEGNNTRRDFVRLPRKTGR